MQIEEIERLSSERNGLSASNTTSEFSPSKVDIDFFTSILDHSTPQATATATASEPNLLAKVSNELMNSTDVMSRSLRLIARDANRDELTKLPNRISNSLFLSQILVKSLGKTTQCIDKICNLQ